MRNSRSVEHAALNNPPVARRGTSAFARSTSRCRWRTRALASAAETVDVEDELPTLLTLLLLLSRVMLSRVMLPRVMLSRVIELDPTRVAPGFRSRLNNSAGLGGRAEGGGAGVAERR